MMRRNPNGPMLEDDEYPSLGKLLVRKVSAMALGYLSVSHRLSQHPPPLRRLAGWKLRA